MLIALAAACATWLAIGESPVAAAPNDLSLRATYNATAFVHWSTAAMSVSSRATVTNTTGGALSALTFNLVTLRTGDARVTRVTVDGTPANVRAAGQTIVVTLPAKLPPGQVAHVRIDYNARFNAAAGVHKSLFIKKDRIVAAYRWIPWLSREQRFSAPNFGETWVTGISPRVTVTLNSDVRLKWVTSGVYSGSGAAGKRFTAHDVRDFNFSASPDYVVTRAAHGGVNVRFYSVGTIPTNVRKWTLAALDRFDLKLGAYPYSHLSVAMTPGGTGMESPGMTWISTSAAARHLPYIASHEVAHQWFYSVLGNNQATEPFLDEGVSDFLSRDLTKSFRTSRCAADRLDGAVYAYGAKCYPEVIYVQGANYLNRYRNEVGNTAFWTGMRTYYREHRYRIGRTRKLLDYLDAASGYDSQRHARRFPSLY
jgi:hypothetical protein